MDTVSGDITPIQRSVSTAEHHEPGGDAVDISADGRYVAFASSVNGLVPSDSNRTEDVFVYDRIADVIERISQPLDGVESGQPSGVQGVPNTGGAFDSALGISADGRYVVFMSAAPNLVRQKLAPCQLWLWVDPYAGLPARLSV